MTTEKAAKLYLAQQEYEHEGRQPIIFNPENKDIDELPVIMAFSNVIGGGDGCAYAMAEDGVCLGGHWCSNEGYVKADLAVIDGWRNDRHEDYRKHYPSGYRMEFVASCDIEGHEKLQRAFELNQKLCGEDNGGQYDRRRTKSRNRKVEA